MDSMTHLPPARMNDLVVQELATEVLVYDSKNDKAFCLNDTLKIVFQACDGKTSFAELRAKHGLTDDLIFLALDELRGANLLDEGHVYNSPWAGLSRRDVLAKIGVASMFALPAILSTTVPTPAQAASLLPLLASCSDNAQCESNFCTQGPPRCCVPGTQGIRSATVCCTAGVNCDVQCCVGPVASFPFAPCAGFGGSAVNCPG